ncbi:GTPase Era [Arenibaculum pallidiluteum]|uniref:GTPase Era n=1 Tax=Arenibaculum pallidiluteum TaxID=2812559 RepID=UPI001A96B910|nr:GTPase Era [Arenibaculum pallidiluteum]
MLEDQDDRPEADDDRDRDHDPDAVGPADNAGEAVAEPENPRAGFVALVGAPNAGKSTLLNALVGAKVSIVSPKVQTTRARVLGIVIEGDSQIVFVDTPGIFEPRKRLERAMVAAAWKGAEDADEILVLVDSSRRGGIDDNTRAIVARLKETGRKALAALTKVDLIRRDRLLGLAAELDAEGVFTEIFMISAVTADGMEGLRKALAARMPAGPWLYPADQISDMPMRLIAAEIVREKLFLQLHEELPYSATVETETWEEFQDGSVRIGCQITVRREGQRAIVLGKGGTRIKSLGLAARKELEEFLERRVHLKLHVRVREDWAENPEHYKPWGLDFNA